MALFDFPNSPTLNQQVTMPDGTVRQWDGTKWKAGGATATGPYLQLSGGAMSGAMTVVGNAAAALQPVPLQQLSSTLATTAPALNNVGRSYIHNGLMTIQQRGQGPWTTSLAYTVDRWVLQFLNGSMSVAVGTLTDANRAQIGDEAATFYLSNTFTGGAAAGDYSFIVQFIEDVRRLAGKTVTVSFYASCASGTPRVGVQIYQSFGSGGSPSPPVSVPGTSVTVSTTWQRYSVTVAVPSVSGKTFGTNSGTAFTGLRFWFSAGSNSAPDSGSVGVQSGTVALWGIQLEIGSVATPLEKLDPRNDLANCQRFYTPGAILASFYSLAGAAVTSFVSFPVSMRATPTMTQGAGNTISNINSFGLSASTFGVWINGTGAATSTVTAYVNFIASADL